MPEFKHPPSIQVLQALVGATFTDSNNLNKAIRLWYTLHQLGTEYQPAQFTDRHWREYLYKSPDNNRDKKPTPIDGCICTKTIADILFDRRESREESWSDWKQSLQAALSEYYGARDIPEIASQKLAAYLKVLELEKPFDVTGKTILGDLKALTQTPKSLGKKYLIAIGSSNFELPDKFPPIIRQEYQMETILARPTEPPTFVEPAYLTGDFSSFAYLFTEPTKDIQRFHIHVDHHIHKDKVFPVNQYLKRLKENWSKDRTTPYQLQYYSSSQINKDRRYTVVVYPVCLYYYQRAFYLCAFGSGLESASSWHNYRLDRIERLEDLDWEWHRKIIPQLLYDRIKAAREDTQLLDEAQLLDDDRLLDIVRSGLDEAYGFDFYRSSAEMLLRFNRSFHDRYIDKTWRHNSFKLVNDDEIEDRSILEKIALPQRKFINARIELHPKDAYYTMNYRVDDNSVIMRLRAWGPNVEVLSPVDLRDRMHGDLQKTWESYRKVGE
jgi:CRISPR-associated protein (TIGR03985 family)